ncbi:hypothetical protein V1525DRAFT_433995 [Lipomyces kononenkoae]|uniref:Uncharacterized protein n=1 Tax=Lipomyces kononenkoae TaxID=34357 RepID=A0ACC3SZG8_LIPKO
MARSYQSRATHTPQLSILSFDLCSTLLAEKGFNSLSSLCPSCFGCSDAQCRQDRPTISVDGNFQQLHGRDISPRSTLGKELNKDFLAAVNKFMCMLIKFSCQVKYHPHRRPGLGDTDGEGIERYWSTAAFLFLVRQLKTSSATHRRQSVDAHIEYTSTTMTTEVGASLCSRLWRDEILTQIESQEAYVAARTKHRVPPHFEEVRNVANNIERLMIERNYELEQVHTRLRGHKKTQFVLNKMRRRRPTIEMEIRKYNNLIEALPLRPELKPPKISYETLVKEMNGNDDFGITPSDLPSWVDNPSMRKSYSTLNEESSGRVYAATNESSDQSTSNMMSTPGGTPPFGRSVYSPELLNFSAALAFLGSP